MGGGSGEALAVSLTLIMRSYQRLLPEQVASKTLEQGLLKIGRNPQNDWVILDPERVVSKTHCTIETAGTDFVLTDTSANGVFINVSEEPVGNGNQVTLRNGDQIRISDYNIEVVIAAGDQPAAPIGSPAGDPASLLSGGAAADDPFNLGRNSPPRPSLLDQPPASTPAPGAAAQQDIGNGTRKPYIQLSWIDAGGKRHSASYSVEKWGLRRAVWNGCMRLFKERPDKRDPREMYEIAYPNILKLYGPQPEHDPELPGEEVPREAPPSMDAPPPKDAQSEADINRIMSALSPSR